MPRLLRKAIIHGIIIVPLLMWVAQADLVTALTAALSLTLVSYFINEHLLLKATNPLIAALDAGITALVVLWIYTDYAEWNVTFGSLILIAILFTFMEWIAFTQVQQARSR